MSYLNRNSIDSVWGSRTLCLICALLFSILIGCGGGGGGKSSTGAPAQLSFSLSDNEIDSGDVTELEIAINKNIAPRVALKVKYPIGLKYVTGSSVLSTDGGGELFIDPAVEAKTEDAVYLVYYLRLLDSGTTVPKTLFLELQGVSKVDKGKVEVDVDLDDPDVNNIDEFNSASPEFSAQASADIKVRGDEPVEPTTTPTTPTATAKLSISASPATLDTGDIMDVTIGISSLVPDAVILKVRYPTALKYLADQGSLIVSNEAVARKPDRTVLTADKAIRYDLYYLSKKVLGESKRGEINFQLFAKTAIKSTVAADVDLDNPALANESEFKIEDPKFTSQVSAAIVISGNDSSATK